MSEEGNEGDEGNGDEGGGGWRGGARRGGARVGTGFGGESWDGWDGGLMGWVVCDIRWYAEGVWPGLFARSIHVKAVSSIRCLLLQMLALSISKVSKAM